MSDHIKDAFEQTITDAVQVNNTWYLSLFEEIPYYGGPEEGGWWGSDSILQAYKSFETEEAAKLAHAAVIKQAESLSLEARRDYGKQCLQETEWLEARGLEDSFLPEVAGESRFFVTLEESDQIPHSVYGTRGYS